MAASTGDAVDQLIPIGEKRLRQEPECGAVGRKRSYDREVPKRGQQCSEYGCPRALLGQRTREQKHVE